MKIHGFEAVDTVEYMHGWRFADEFLSHAVPSDATVSAYNSCGVATYPEGDQVAAQQRFEDIEEEIVSITFARVRRAIGEAFVLTANEVLNRERGR